MTILRPAVMLRWQGFFCPFRTGKEEKNKFSGKAFVPRRCPPVCVGFPHLFFMTLLPKQYPKHRINTKEDIKGPRRFPLQRRRAEIDDVGPCVYSGRLSRRW